MPSEAGLRTRLRAVLAAGATGALVFVLPWGPIMTGSMAAIRPVAHSAPAPTVRAITVRPPGLSHAPQGTGLYSVTCPQRDYCVAGGNYEQRDGSVQAMVADETGGMWSPPVTLRLPPNAMRQPYAKVNSVTCGQAGDCVAVGSYTYDAGGRTQAFIATEADWRWGRAVAPELPPNLSSHLSAELTAVTCDRAGDCEAVGTFQDSHGHEQAMALAKPPGQHWQRAAEIAAPAGAAASPSPLLSGLACPTFRSCVTVGSYLVNQKQNQSQAMGAVETGGKWQRAVRISAPDGAVPGNFTAITSLVCHTHGRCLGVGAYPVSASRDRAMTVTESHGKFGTAEPVTAVPHGSAKRPSTAFSALSCPLHGACTAVGVATNAAGHTVALYAVMTRHGWAETLARPPAGASTGKAEQSSLFGVACPAARECTAVGYYNDNSGGYRAQATVSA